MLPKKKIGKIKNIFQKYKMLFLLVAVIAVSGCVIPGGDVFAGMFSPQRPATTEASADLITTQNVNIIPNPPISADNGFTVSFEVKNNDENEEVKNVKVTNYDTGLCKKGKTTTPDSGGVAESDIVKALDNKRLIVLKVHCDGKTDTTNTDILFLEENEKTTPIISICGKTPEYKASIKDYTLTLLKAGSALNSVGKEGRDTQTGLEYIKFTTVAGKIWDCLEGKYGDKEKYKDNCFLKDGNTLYSLAIPPEYKEKADCIGKAKDSCFVSSDDCTAACDKRNTDCKGGPDNKVGCYGKYGPGGTVKNDPDLLTACNNQCDKYRYEVQQSEAAPCNPPVYIPSAKTYVDRILYDGSYDGVCCVCDIVDQTIDTSVSTATTSTTVAGSKIYYPLQTELFEWGFTAPTNKNMGNMPTTCPIRYKITYAFTAKSQADISVISKSKMEELQRAGQEPSASPTQSVGVGPIKIFFDFGAKQPVRSGDVLPIFVTVEDRGTGVYGNIPVGKLKIKMPSNFEKITCDKFTGSGGELKNSAEIPMIKKKSPQLRCSFKMPSVTDIKTFYITGELEYDYKLDNQINVAVNPTLVR